MEKLERELFYHDYMLKQEFIDARLVKSGIESACNGLEQLKGKTLHPIVFVSPLRTFSGAQLKQRVTCSKSTLTRKT